MALFGSGSWFNTAQDAASQSQDEQHITYFHLCAQELPLHGYMVYVGLVCSANAREYTDWAETDRLVYNWFGYLRVGTSEFLDQGRPEVDDLLTQALFSTNQAILQVAAEKTAGDMAREISTATGTRITKPVASLASKIIISIFIGVQVIALIMLMKFVYSVPTFSSHLDAVSLLILGAELKDVIGNDTPRLGLADAAAMKKLERVNAMVGIQDSAAVEMASMHAARHDSNATLNEDASATIDTSAAAVDDAMSEATITMGEINPRSVDANLPLSERSQSYLVSTKGSGLISRRSRMIQHDRQDSRV